MRLGVFLSDFRTDFTMLDRLSTEEIGIILVGNGVNHATLRENGKASPVLDKSSSLYVLSEDLETRGFSAGDVDSRVKVITYSDLVDIIFNDYEKLVWI